ncbi:MAG: isochorismatase family cysteine hydrolase [Pseudomonadota bacterium]
MNHTCLLVIDMLNDFLDRWDTPTRDSLIQKTNELIGACRKRDLPVIWVRQEFKKDLSDAFLEMRDKKISMTISGTRGAQIHSDLDYQETDRLFLKKRYSAFFQTGLDEELSKLQVERIILAGVNTHACIRMAAIDAYQRDLRVILATDCIDSIDQEHHEISLRYMSGKIAITRTNAQIDATEFT